MIRHVGLTSHRRAVFREAEEAGGIDVIHVRYNATHRGAETDVFPFVRPEGGTGPGVVSFTATDWKRLLSPKRMPPGEAPLTAADCYRFVLAEPAVDVCMMGAASLAEMHENLDVLDAPPLTAEERARILRIGDHVYGKARSEP
jgi:aryl-alcohol dehydrogenase-like predicted oxidoreductase